MRRLLSRLFPSYPPAEFIRQCDAQERALDIALELARLRLREMMQAETRSEFEGECG